MAVHGAAVACGRSGGRPVFSWVQQRVATAAVTALNRNGNTRFELGSFRLRFPLRLEVSGLYMIDNASGDTLVAAREAEASAVGSCLCSEAI